MNAKSRTVLGLDIGGANIKAATAAQRAVSVAFPLWKQPDALPAALASLVSQFPGIDEFAVTMTGELCDCYATKREGVNRILDAVEFAAAGRPVRAWGTGGNWLSVAEARVRTLEVAASNWHALATFAAFVVAGTVSKGDALLIDIGSTTTDLIRLKNGRPVIRGRTDFERLRTGELLYLGVKRTPIMALGMPNVCAEYFADTRDMNIVLDFIAEEPEATDTADGRPATWKYSLARMARMLGGDTETLSEGEIRGFSRDCFRHLRGRLSEAIRASLLDVETTEEGADPPTLFISGSGEWIALKSRRAAVTEFNDYCLSEAVSPEISACAAAYAVAVLA